MDWKGVRKASSLFGFENKSTSDFSLLQKIFWHQKRNSFELFLIFNNKNLKFERYKSGVKKPPESAIENKNISLVLQAIIRVSISHILQAVQLPVIDDRSAIPKSFGQRQRFKIDVLNPIISTTP